LPTHEQQLQSVQLIAINWICRKT